MFCPGSDRDRLLLILEPWPQPSLEWTFSLSLHRVRVLSAAATALKSSVPRSAGVWRGASRPTRPCPASKPFCSRPAHPMALPGRPVSLPASCVRDTSPSGQPGAPCSTGAVWGGLRGAHLSWATASELLSNTDPLPFPACFASRHFIYVKIEKASALSHPVRVQTGALRSATLPKGQHHWPPALGKAPGLPEPQKAGVGLPGAEGGTLPASPQEPVG